MKTLGVTGGIGSGKTTACRMLEALGARVFYADAEARRLMEADPHVRAAIAAAFGAESYDAEGRLDRAYLAEHVFGEAARVERLNAIVHPRVYDAFGAAARRAEREGVEVLVLEAALIFESGGERHLDAVAVVDAPEAARIRRVAARDETAPEAVRARMAHQLPPHVLRRRADHVLVNDGDLEALRRQVRALYREITANASA